MPRKALYSIVVVLLVAIVGVWYLMRAPGKSALEQGQTSQQSQNTTSQSRNGAIDPLDAQSGSLPPQGGTPVTPPPAKVSPPAAQTPPPSTGAGTYTMAQVATHNSASSCWTAIRGGVYDLTKWIPMHPGGAANILQICGKDGTAAFDGQHEGQGRPENTLAKYQIGTLQ